MQARFVGLKAEEDAQNQNKGCGNGKCRRIGEREHRCAEHDANAVGDKPEQPHANAQTMEVGPGSRCREEQQQLPKPHGRA